MTSIKEVADSAHKGIDHAAEAATNASASVRDKGQQAKATQEEWVKELNSYVQQNPATSIGIAVASGFVLGWILRRR